MPKVEINTNNMPQVPKPYLGYSVEDFVKHLADEYNMRLFNEVTKRELYHDVEMYNSENNFNIIVYFDDYKNNVVFQNIPTLIDIRKRKLNKIVQRCHANRREHRYGNR